VVFVTEFEHADLLQELEGFENLSLKEDDLFTDYSILHTRNFPRQGKNRYIMSSLNICVPLETAFC